MSGIQVEVLVDEAFSDSTGKSFLKTQISVNGSVKGGLTFPRQASPQIISDILNETGCLIKYGEENEDLDELSEQVRQRLVMFLLKPRITFPDSQEVKNKGN